MKTTFLKQHFLFAILSVCYSLISFGQTGGASLKGSSLIAQQQPLQYVKIEIGMNILDCPILPKNLKKRLRTLNGIKDYSVDKKSQSILFNIPEGVITKEGIAIIAKSCGFPAQSVNIVIENKPFVHKIKTLK